MANMYINAMTDLWNSAGTTYSSIKMNVTNAASAAASKLLQLQIASVDKFSVDKDGNVVSVGTVTSAGTISSAAHLPSGNDAAALGASGTAWSDLFLADGGVINWSASDVTVTHSTDQLFFAGAVNGYRFDAALRPTTADGAAIGSGLTPWSDLYLASGAVVDFGGDVNFTHAADTMTMNGGDLRVATTGSNASSVVLVGGTQTLTNKTLTTPTINNPTVTTGTFTNPTLNTPAISGATIAGPSGTFTTLVGTTTSGTTGSFTTSVFGGEVQSNQNFEAQTTAAVLGTTGAGNIYLRPNGVGSGTGQVHLASTGTLTVNGRTITGSYYQSSGTNVVVSANSGGVYLRPYGPDNATNEVYVLTDGGIRSNFFHASTGHATHSFYNGTGPTGASSFGAYIHGNGSSNTAAGLFITYSGSTSYAYIGFHQPGIAYWALYCSGPCVGHSWQIHSDIRTKSDLKDCDCEDAYRKVLAIPAKSYRKKDTFLQQRHAYDEMGWVAQDIEPIIPEAVTDIPVPKRDDNGAPLTSTETTKVVNDRTLMATLWGAFQHQAHIIEALEAKVAALEGASHG